jgi:hypothetical protein
MMILPVFRNNLHNNAEKKALSTNNNRKIKNRERKTKKGNRCPIKDGILIIASLPFF